MKTRLVRTELLKQRTIRMFVIAAAAVPVLSVLVAGVVLGGAGKDGNEPLGPTSFARTIGAPTSLITMIAVMLGVVGMAGEYRHQTITATVLATPRRRDLLIAKLVAHALSAAAMAVLSITISAAIAVPWLRSRDVATPVDALLLRVIACVVLSTALYGALGVAIGALVRNQSGAIAVVLGWLLAAEGMISDALRRYEFVDWLPAAAGRAMVRVDTTQTLAAPLATAIFVGYVAVLAVAGVRFTIPRDIT